jgi:peptidoglycan L-alanyl-D-glutamate endopeptidase CwlK
MSAHLRFGERSLARLATCDERLVKVATLALKVGMDFTVVSGWRGEAEQNDLYSRGLSKQRWPDSHHNAVTELGDPRSLAIDVAPWPIDWRDAKAFYHLAGVFRAVAFDLAIPLRWGGDWDMDFDLSDQTFMDLGHFELPRSAA